jgi:alpha/beta superfamily hydrolase
LKPESTIPGRESFIAESRTQAASHARVDFVARIPEESQYANNQPGTIRDEPVRVVTSHRGPINQLDHAEVVSGRWLVKAILAVLAAAGLALYLSICLLFYQGQWQFTFSPPKTVPLKAISVAAASGLPITDVRFDTTEEGVQRLDGWWIPADAASAPMSSIPSFVVLFCPNGHTDLAANVDALKAFHSLGVNIFAFDYQGVGASQAGHPSQQQAYANGVAALNYLAGLRHIPADRIVIYGARLGAAVAAHVAQSSPNIAGLILEDPQPSLTIQVKDEQHIHLLPMWLVFQDRFDISGVVPSLHMPKLILSTAAMRSYAAGATQVYDQSPAPRQKSILDGPASRPAYSQPEWHATVGTFLNNLAHQPANGPLSRTLK